MGFLVHLVVFAAVNALLVLLWAVGEQDISTMDALTDPVAAARDHDFWPLWVIAPWAAALVIHLAIAVQVHRLRQRRRRRAWLEAKRARRAGQVPAAAAQPVIPSRRWVVALFTDVVGSSGLAESLGDDEWSEIIGHHRRAVRACLAAHGGAEVGTQGDGFLLRFDRPAEAVRCAVDLQRGFEADREAGRFTPPVRIGLHAGEAVGADDGDLIGRALNVASRVMALAGPGEIMVTEPVADQLGPDVVMEDRGLQELRGIGQHRHLLAIQWREEELPRAEDVLGPEDAALPKNENTF